MKVLEALKLTYEAVKAAKPNDRSDVDRAYAVTLTDLEKVIAYFQVYAVKS